MNQTERCLLCRTVDLRVAGLRQRLNKGVQIFLMLSDIASEVGKDGFVEPPGLAVCLCVIRRSS